MATLNNRSIVIESLFDFFFLSISESFKLSNSSRVLDFSGAPPFFRGNELHERGTSACVYMCCCSPWNHLTFLGTQDEKEGKRTEPFMRSTQAWALGVTRAASNKEEGGKRTYKLLIPFNSEFLASRNWQLDTEVLYVRHVLSILLYVTFRPFAEEH